VRIAWGLSFSRFNNGTLATHDHVFPGEALLPATTLKFRI
jgi:hypothetical protein